MSRGLRFSPAFKDDLDSIFYYIAEDNPSAASKFVKKIKDTCRHIARFPEIGVARDDIGLGTNLRSFPIGNYILFYRISVAHVEMVRIIHGSRDIAY
jgi:toxin ParE1/3/4